MISQVLNQMTGEKTDVYLQIEGQWVDRAMPIPTHRVIYLNASRRKIVNAPSPVLRLWMFAVGTGEAPLNKIAEWLDLDSPMVRVVMEDELDVLLPALLTRFPLAEKFTALTKWVFEESYGDRIPTFCLTFVKVMEDVQ